MHNFVDKRHRCHDNAIFGEIIDPDSKLRVRYENGRTSRITGDRPATINWTALGDQPLDVARRYAQQILAACDAAEVLARDFEPDDEITFRGLPEEHKAFITSIVDGMLICDQGVPGPKWETTVLHNIGVFPDEATLVQEAT